MKLNLGQIIFGVSIITTSGCGVDSLSQRSGEDQQSYSTIKAKYVTDCNDDCDVSDKPSQKVREQSKFKKKYSAHPGQHPGQSPSQTSVKFPHVLRTIDGKNNNPFNKNWGAAETPFERIVNADYTDGVGSPAGANRPSARAVSNGIVAQSDSIINEKNTSDFIWQWGQFLDHDIGLTEEVAVEEAIDFSIAVPTGDASFDPSFTGAAKISMRRSETKRVSGVNEQINEITAYIDASNVYGSSASRAKALRRLDGSGKLKTSAGNLLPFNTDGIPNADSTDESLFVAGDVRVNEQIGLTVMHTLFVREHNWLCDFISKKYPYYSGETVYQMARGIVGAQMQVITYNEFLPALLGDNALRPYTGYKSNTDASVSNEFTTAAYRFGHSTISPTLLRLNRNLDPISKGNLDLKASFFDPSLLTAENDIDPLLRGLATQAHQKVDPYIVDGLRNFLFGAPGSGGFDLASLNIQRGRDHGLPSYNDMRGVLGFARVSNFSDISSDSEIVNRLASTYNTVDDIDLWVGGLAEDHVQGSQLGELFTKIVSEQFERLRDGDRFYYESYLGGEWKEWVSKQSLAKIIRRNTQIGYEISDNVFFAP